MKSSLSASIGRKKKAMFSSQGASDHAADAGIYGQAMASNTGILSGNTITGAQAAAMQNAAYNGLLQNAQNANNPHMISKSSSGWRDYERSAPSVGINVERAANGYIIRSNGSSIVAMTLEDVQQHVTAIVVSNLVMERGE